MKRTRECEGHGGRSDVGSAENPLRQCGLAYEIAAKVHEVWLDRTLRTKAGPRTRERRHLVGFGNGSKFRWCVAVGVSTLTGPSDASHGEAIGGNRRLCHPAFFGEQVIRVGSMQFLDTRKYGLTHISRRRHDDDIEFSRKAVQSLGAVIDVGSPRIAIGR